MISIFGIKEYFEIPVAPVVIGVAAPEYIDFTMFKICSEATSVPYNCLKVSRLFAGAPAPAPGMTKATTVGYGRHLLADMDMAMAPAPAMTKATTVGYGRHLLAAMAPAPAMMKATTVGYGRHLLAAMAPAPAMMKATTVGYGRHLLAAMAPAPAMMKATTVGYGRHLLADMAPAPSSESPALCLTNLLHCWQWCLSFASATVLLELYALHNCFRIRSVSWHWQSV